MRTILKCLVLMLACGLVPLGASLAQNTVGDDDPCTEIAPESASQTFFVGLGDVAFDQREYTQAITAYTCAIERDPTYVPAYINRGFAHAIQLNDPQALADYNQALELNAAATAAYNNRGLLYFNQGTFGLALTDFTVAISLDPNYAIAYHNRALVHAAEGNYDLALGDLEQAILLDPTYAAPYASLGAVYSAQALASYDQYRAVAGEQALLPGITPENIISALAENAAFGTFTTWLDFATPAREGG